jgi:hypothetical protein
MNIYNNLPPEIQTKIKYMVLQHPTAKIINDEIERLNCDITFKFKEKAGGPTICKIQGIEFFANEYYLRGIMEIALAPQTMICLTRYLKFRQHRQMK